MIGHIKLDRKILDWEWYQDNNTFRLFLHLLLTANHKEGKWQGNLIKRGQLITGLTKLSASTGLSVRSLRTSFDKLKTTGEITIKTTSKFRVITICKYDTYQSFKDDSDKQNDKHLDKQATSERQTNDKQTTTNNNVNNNKEERVIGITPTIDISKSNLFRQPSIPDKNQVWEVFSRMGGSKEMAKTFYDNNEGTGWFLKGSPITNFHNLVPSFIANWKKIEDRNKPIDSTNVKIKL